MRASAVARALALALAPLAILSVFVACAVGSGDETPPGNVFPDAGSLEADTIPDRGDADGPDPEIDSGVTKDSGGNTTKCENALKNYVYDFGTDQGWTHKPSDGAEAAAPSWPLDPWTRGTSSALACPSGSCFGAELSQNYAQCQRGELVSPKIDLSECKGSKVALVFTHAYSFWTGPYNSQTWFDGGIVEISSDDGANYAVPTSNYPGTVKINPDRGASYPCVLKDQFHVHNKPGFTGAQTSPTKVEIEVPSSAFTTNVRVRFSQASGVSSSTTSANTSRSATAPGWRVDEVHFVLK